jgi:hypothetical protein
MATHTLSRQLKPAGHGTVDEHVVGFGVAPQLQPANTSESAKSQGASRVMVTTI